MPLKVSSAPSAVHQMCIRDSFYRVDKARSRAAGGTGLGLSIVHDTAARWGGSVTARARPGGGTVFVLTLPLWREEDAP